ncbi:MAG: hypothetical protein WEE66_02065 [Actinomycetota bacterium]
MRARLDALLEAKKLRPDDEAQIVAMTAGGFGHKAISEKLHVPALAVAKIQHGLNLVDWSGNAAIARWAAGKPKK